MKSELSLYIINFNSSVYDAAVKINSNSTRTLIIVNDNYKVIGYGDDQYTYYYYSGSNPRAFVPIELLNAFPDLPKPTNKQNVEIIKYFCLSKLSCSR